LTALGINSTSISTIKAATVADQHGVNKKPVEKKQ